MYHRAQSLPLKFLLLILKFRGAKGFEDTILPPATQKPITAMFKKKKKKKLHMYTTAVHKLRHGLQHK